MNSLTPNLHHDFKEVLDINRIAKAIEKGDKSMERTSMGGYRGRGWGGVCVCGGGLTQPNPHLHSRPNMLDVLTYNVFDAPHFHRIRSVYCGAATGNILSLTKIPVPIPQQNIKQRSPIDAQVNVICI